MVGKAASLRRRRILYNRRHQENLRRKPAVVDTAPNAKLQKLQSLLLADFIALLATGYPAVKNETPEIQDITQESIRRSETTGYTLPDSDKASDAAASEISMASTGSMLQDLKLNYPPAPLIKDGMSEVACPYCVAVLQEHEVSNTRSWR
ncbi:MAG: hypothetical protein M1829_000453 [Trizodia sp. TS-e1964]|nr:MAG: hypothetical protein M1829_000453 [Trizodia sp. TS-e1964]